MSPAARRLMQTAPFPVVAPLLALAPTRSASIEITVLRHTEQIEQGCAMQADRQALMLHTASTAR